MDSRRGLYLAGFALILLLGDAGCRKKRESDQPVASGVFLEAPTNLEVSAISSNQIRITWNDNSSNEEWFRIEMAIPGASFVEWDAVSRNTTAYTVHGLRASSTYLFRVRASAGSFLSPYSNSSSATTPAMSDVEGNPIRIAATYQTSFYRTNGGTVKSWGFNRNGELGNGATSTLPNPTPLVISGLGNVLSVASGHSHALALLSDGTVKAWGWNGFGQLGDGTTLDRETPVSVVGLSGIKSVVAGGSFSLALGSDGAVYSWGNNWYGSLGNGTTSDLPNPIPIRVSGIAPAKSLAAGVHHVLALIGSDVYVWGSSFYGGLGLGNTANQAAPVRNAALSNARAVAAGSYHSLVLMNDGSILAFGQNEFGQVGNGAGTATQSFPVAVQWLSPTGSPPIVLAGGNTHSLCILADGSVWGWGDNGMGQIGVGTTDGPILNPVRVSGLPVRAVSVTGGYLHSLALLETGKVYAWGGNLYGQLGNGTVEHAYSPVEVNGIP